MNHTVTTRTVSEAIAEVLRERDDTVFGLMGNGNSYLMSSLTTFGPEVVWTRHEAATIMAAQAYHHSTGRTATATVTFGPGFTNMLTSLAESRLARVPVVVIVGDAPTTGRRIQDLDQTAIAAAFDVRTFKVSVDDAAAQTRRAFEIAERDRVPVIVAIPYDLMAAEARPEQDLPTIDQSDILPEAERWGADDLDPDVISEIAAVLAAAERPLIVTGRGAVLSGAGEVARELGDRVGALFATSINAEKITGSEWDLGVAGGFAARPQADLMAEADVVLALGASLNLYQMRYNLLAPNAERFIQVDVLPQATHALVTDYIRHDATQATRALIDALPAEHTSEWRAQLGSLDPVFATATSDLPEFGPDGRLDPRALMVKLNEILPRERTIAQDGGHFMGWAVRYLDAPDPRGKQLAMGIQSIGLGMGSALGIAHGRPDRLAVLVAGDGGSTMSLGEFDTMIRTIKSGIALIMNDSSYAMEVHQYLPQGLDTAAMEFPDQNFHAIAEAMGGRGITLASHADLAQLEAWLADGATGLLIVDARISKAVIADWLEASNVYYSNLLK